MLGEGRERQRKGRGEGEEVTLREEKNGSERKEQSMRGRRKSK